MADEEPGGGGGDAGGTSRRQRVPTSGRTKSSVRRAREFKQFDQVNLLEVGGSDDFDLIHSKRSPGTPTHPTGGDIPSYNEAVATDVLTNTSAGPLVFGRKSAPAVTAGGTSPRKSTSATGDDAKPAPTGNRRSSFAGSTGGSTAGAGGAKKTITSNTVANARELREGGRASTGTPRGAVTSSHAAPVAPGGVGAGRTTPRGTLTASHAAPRHPVPSAAATVVTRPSLSRLSTDSVADARSASVKAPSPTLAAVREELAAYKKTAEGEMATLRETIEKSKVEHDETLEKERTAWKMEREGLLAGMRSGGREVERLSAEATDLRLAVAELKAAGTAASEAAEKAKAGLEAQLAEATERAATLTSLKAAAEGSAEELSSKAAALSTQVTSLEASLRQRTAREAHLAARVKCLLLTAEELGRSAEGDRVDAESRHSLLASDVARLDTHVESLERTLQRERAAAQAAQRSLEAAEAVQKRMEAEKVRLVDQNNNVAAAALAASASASGVAPAVEELKKELDAAKTDKEAIWQEYEMLTHQHETVKQEVEVLRRRAAASPTGSAGTGRTSPLPSAVSPAGGPAAPDDRAQLQDALETLRTELAAAQRERDAAKETSTAATATAEEIEELHASLDALQAEKAAVVKDKQALAVENDRLSGQVNSLAAKRSEDALQVVDLKREVEVLSKDKDCMWEECEALAQQVEELRGETAKAKQQGPAAERVTAELTARIDRAEADLAEAQADNIALRAAAAAATATSNTVADMQKLIDALTKDKETMWAECEALTHRLQAFEQEKAMGESQKPESDDACGAMQEAIDALTAEKAAAMRECADLATQLEAAGRERDTSDRDAAAAVERVAELEGQVKALARDKDTMWGECEALTDKLRVAEAAAETLASKDTDARGVAEAAEQRVADMQKTIDGLTRDKDTIWGECEALTQRLQAAEAAAGAAAAAVSLSQAALPRVGSVASDIGVGGVGSPASGSEDASRHPASPLHLHRSLHSLAKDRDCLWRECEGLTAQLAMRQSEAAAHQRTVLRLQADKMYLLEERDRVAEDLAALRAAVDASAEDGGADPLLVAQLRKDLEVARSQVQAYGSAAIQRDLDALRGDFDALNMKHTHALQKLAVYERLVSDDARATGGDAGVGASGDDDITPRTPRAAGDEALDVPSARLVAPTPGRLQRIRDELMALQALDGGGTGGEGAATGMTTPRAESAAPGPASPGAGSVGSRSPVSESEPSTAAAADRDADHANRLARIRREMEDGAGGAGVSSGSFAGKRTPSPAQRRLSSPNGLRTSSSLADLQELQQQHQQSTQLRGRALRATAPETPTASALELPQTPEGQRSAGAVRAGSSPPGSASRRDREREREGFKQRRLQRSFDITSPARPRGGSHAPTATSASTPSRSPTPPSLLDAGVCREMSQSLPAMPTAHIDPTADDIVAGGPPSTDGGPPANVPPAPLQPHLPEPTPMMQLLHMAAPVGPFGWGVGACGAVFGAAGSEKENIAPPKSRALYGKATKFGFVPPAGLDAPLVACDMSVVATRARKKSLHQARMARKVEGGTQQQVGARRQNDTFDTIMDEVMRKTGPGTGTGK